MNGHYENNDYLINHTMLNHHTTTFQKGIRTIMRMALFRRIAVCVSASALLATFSTTMASAADVTSDNAKVSASSYAAYTSSLSKADKAAIAAKEAECKKLTAEKAQTGHAASLKRLQNFTIYMQEEDNYCAPACVKSALRFIAGSSPSQTTIHKSLNMNFTKIPGFMNAREKKCYYVLGNFYSTADLMGKIETDVVRVNVPVFLRIDGTTSSNWYYATNGHCILATGIYTDKSKVQIADPLGNRLPGCPYFYLKDASQVARFTTHFAW